MERPELFFEFLSLSPEISCADEIDNDKGVALSGSHTRVSVIKVSKCARIPRPGTARNESFSIIAPSGFTHAKKDASRLTPHAFALSPWVVKS